MASPTPDPTKPNSRAHRRAGTAGATTRRPATVELPYENGAPSPPFPPGFTPTADEIEMWHDLWLTGESTQWRDADHPAVAVLCRLQTKVWDGTAKPADLSSLRALQAALGLTPQARAALGWVAADDGESDDG